MIRASQDTIFFHLKEQKQLLQSLNSVLGSTRRGTGNKEWIGPDHSAHVCVTYGNGGVVKRLILTVDGPTLTTPRATSSSSLRTKPEEKELTTDRNEHLIRQHLFFPAFREAIYGKK